jgi:triphosphoribosyl-dephospho-CoA synthase
LSPGRLAEIACVLEVSARKPGNVHRLRDFPDLTFLDLLLSAGAIAEPLDRAIPDGVGAAVFGAIAATRRVVATNTNLGMVLLLAPLAAVPDGVELQEGIETVLETTTVADSRAVYRAIRLAQPGGMGDVPDQDLADEPTMSLRDIMRLAADRDLIASQYADGFQEVLGNALPVLRSFLGSSQDLETAIVAAYLNTLARHPDSLIARKAGIGQARDVSRRAAEILDGGWPDREESRRECQLFDDWLRDPCRRLNPGTTADLVTAALYAALRDGTIKLPLVRPFSWLSH